MTNRDNDHDLVDAVWRGGQQYRGSLAAVRRFSAQEMGQLHEASNFQQRWEMVSQGGTNDLYAVVPSETPEGIRYDVVSPTDPTQVFASLSPSRVSAGYDSYRVEVNGQESAVLDIQDGRSLVEGHPRRASRQRHQHREVAVALPGCVDDGCRDDRAEKLRNLERTQLVLTALMDQVDDEQKDQLNPVHEALAVATTAVEFGQPEAQSDPALAARRAVLGAHLTQEESSLDVPSMLVNLFGVEGDFPLTGPLQP